MKKILALFVMLSSVCFAHTDKMMPNVWKARIMVEKGLIVEAFKYLDELINSEENSDEDKVHYIITKKNLHFNLGQLIELENDNIQLKDLITKSNSCKIELSNHYEISFND